MLMRLQVHPSSIDELAGQANDELRKRVKRGIGTLRPFKAIFYGPVGTGKTDAARLVRQGFQCLKWTRGASKGCGECAPCNWDGVAFNGNAAEYLQFELDGSSPDFARDFQAAVREIHKGIYPAIVIVDEFQKVHPDVRDRVHKFAGELEDGVVIIIVQTDVPDPRRPSVVPAPLWDRLRQFHFSPVPAHEMGECLLRRATAAGLETNREALTRLAHEESCSFRKCFQRLQEDLDELGLE